MGFEIQHEVAPDTSSLTATASGDVLFNSFVSALELHTCSTERGLRRLDIPACTHTIRIRVTLTETHAVA